MFLGYLLNDDTGRRKRPPPAERSDCERPVFVCREVVVELVWVLCVPTVSRESIAAVLGELVAARELEFEAARCRTRPYSATQRARPDFQTSYRVRGKTQWSLSPLYFDQKAAQLDGGGAGRR